MIVKLTDGTILDERYNDSIISIRIVAPGILVRRKSPRTDETLADSNITFYPWHRITFVMGEQYFNSAEHELAQFNYFS